jgi:CRISPR type III-A-associated protein Csm2
MAEKGNKIDLKILDEGVKSIRNLQKWGHYFAENLLEEKTNNQGKKYAEIKLKKVSTSQLRKFFGALKQIQADFGNKKGEIVLLDAKLAYAVGRDVKSGKQESKIKEFYDLVSPMIKEINEDKTKFKYFVDVFEAIVAYHKEKEEVKTQNY